MPCSTRTRVSLGGLSALLRHGAFAGRLEMNPRTPRLRQTDCDRLFRRARTVLALANMVELFAHELARLCRRGPPLTLVSPCAPQRFLVRHDASALGLFSQSWRSRYAKHVPYESRSR